MAHMLFYLPLSFPVQLPVLACSRLLPMDRSLLPTSLMSCITRPLFGVAWVSDSVSKAMFSQVSPRRTLVFS